MTTARCPKCSRLTYSKKWNSCTADGCSLNHSWFVAKPLITAVRLTNELLADAGVVTKPKSPRVTKSAGRPKVHVTPAERQRAYRARKKAVA